MMENRRDKKKKSSYTTQIQIRHPDIIYVENIELHILLRVLYRV